MSEQGSFVSRFKNWFRPGDAAAGPLPLESRPAQDQPIQQVSTSRMTFWRPWARRDAAITSLQQGFTTLSQLMSAIQESLDKQGRRQDEMLSYLSHLPEVLQSLPEGQRAQGETLKAIGQQMQQQLDQQAQLGEILGKLSESHGEQHHAVEGMQEQVLNLSEHNQAISENLRQVSSSLETMGNSAQTSTAVLQQVHEQFIARNNQIETALQKQTTRFTVLMSLAAGLSLTALLAVIIGGLVLLRRTTPPTQLAPAASPSPTTMAVQ